MLNEEQLIFELCDKCKRKVLLNEKILKKSELEKLKYPILNNYVSILTIVYALIIGLYNASNPQNSNIILAINIILLICGGVYLFYEDKKKAEKIYTLTKEIETIEYLLFKEINKPNESKISRIK